MKTSITHLLTGATAALVLALPVGAQAPAGQFTVAARSGYADYGRSTSLEGAPFLGLDAEYGLHKYVGIGTSLFVSRPKTTAMDFLTTQTYGVSTAGDTTFIYGASQAVNVLNGELLASLRYPVGRFTPFLIGGFGMYGMIFDPQVNRGNKSTSGTSASIGGGAAVRLSERAGLQFDVRNLTFFGYNRRDLDPSGGRNANTIFAEDFALPPARSKSVNSLVFTIGFRYVPGGEIEDGPRDPNLPREDRR
jgi:hypothetical protein